MTRMLVFTGILFFILGQVPAQAGLGFLSIFIPKTHPDCTKSLPPAHSNFCPTFKTAATCACASSGVPASFCSDMAKLHKRMLMVFTTQQKACEFQRDTSTQQCLDSWNCYRRGGKDSQGRPCQATGKPCA